MSLTLRICARRTFLGKVIGLLGEKKAYPILINTRFGIHTFGLKFPIDIVVLNNLRCVVKVKQSLQPNKLFFWDLRHDKVLELPEGTIKRKKMKIGDEIHLEVK